MQVTITVDAESAKRNLRGIADDQLPFAEALTLTSLAKLGQDAIRQQLPMRFTIRQLSFMRGNIQILAATKRALVSEVRDTGGPSGALLRDMELQEVSGSKLPMHGQYVCVPLFRVPANGFIPEDKTPKAVMASGRGFIRGNVMYLRGKHYARQHKYLKSWGPTAMVGVARDKIVPMYALVHSARIPKRYGFEDTVRATVEKNVDTEFAKSFEKAVESRK